MNPSRKSQQLEPPMLADYAAFVAQHAPRFKPLPLPQGQPLLSIVTVCRNAAKTLPATIASVKAQTYPWIEHIVIDGASTDGTQDLFTQPNHVARWVSEPDQGISDAFNKGIALARGHYIGILNSDDIWAAETAALSVAALEAHPQAAWSFGACDFTLDGRLVLHRDGDEHYARTIHRWMPCLNHPTVIVRRTIYEQHGLFRLNRRIAMDYDLLLRFDRAGLKGLCLPHTMARMALGGISSGPRIIEAFREASEISIEHGRPRFTAYLDRWRCTALPWARLIAIQLRLNKPWRALRQWRR